MHSSFFRSMLLCGVLTFGSGVKAALIFYDDFSGNTPGVDRTPLGWTIASTGGVDIIGTCNSVELDDLLPGNNCYIDLTSDVGPPSSFGSNGLLSKSLFLPAEYTYIASFVLGGNNVNPFVDNVTVGFGTSIKEITVNTDDSFSPYSISFTPTISDFYTLSFLNSNVDYYGALLDNVRVEQVPGPLPLLGIGTAYAFSRRLRAHRRAKKS
ncbi:MAG: pyruvate-binding protein [Cyanobacteria bacterium K_Offshore_surface_m2_239]|nr:pyruvate-binding protein [Cyanobacteria bacterium K_Offshore_surface_m2_239]